MVVAVVLVLPPSPKLHERVLTVNLARPREERGRGGFDRGRGGGRGGRGGGGGRQSDW